MLISNHAIIPRNLGGRLEVNKKVLHRLMSAFNFQHEFGFYIKQMAPQDCQFYQSAGPTVYHVKMSAKGTYHTLFLKDP